MIPRVVALKKCLGWLLFAGCVCLVAWIRLLPLSLSIVEEQVEKGVRLRIGHRLTLERAATHAAPLSPEVLPHAIDTWIAQHPDQFAREKNQDAEREKSRLRYQGDDGHEYVYLGDFDSYVWLRNARNYLRHGTTCDAITDDACLDTYTHAPVGTEMQYNRSLHIVAIVALHQLITFFAPAYPLPASAFLVPVVIGVLGVVPAFFLGRVVGGMFGGVFAALLSALFPPFLERSMGSDNDVWNVVLPLFMLWAVAMAVQVRTSRRHVWYAVLAGVVCGLHAGTWQGWRFFFVVIVAGLLGSLVVSGGAYGLRQHTIRVWQSLTVRNNILVCGVFVLSAGVSVFVATLPALSVSAPTTASMNLPSRSVTEAPRVANVGDELWPNNFTLVAELMQPNFAHIVATFWGGVLFCSSLLGLLLLLLPTAGWRWRHWLLLCAGGGLFAGLVVVAPAEPPMTIALAAVPFLVAGLGRICDNDAHARVPLGLALSIIAWFFAAWWLSYQGTRFLIILAPPFALGCGSTAGQLLVRGRLLFRRCGRRYHRVAESLVFAGLVGFLIAPVQQAHTVARQYLPAIGDAWWDTFAKIRAESSREAIINVWWDYGYWAKYVAERRVSNDGGSLRTHIPHWLSVAFVTPDETESIGVLRMLNCGSDALPYPEGQRGAYGQILAAGYDPIAAHDLVMELVRLDQIAAQAHLTAKGFSSLQQEQILQATHCRPPESYLITNYELIAQPSIWMHWGLWDFRRAYLTQRAPQVSPPEGMTEIASRLGYDVDEASRLYAHAQTLQTDTQRQAFIAPPYGFISVGWLPCHAHSETGFLECPLTQAAGPVGSMLASFQYRPEALTESFFRLRHAQTTPTEDAPAVGTPGVVVWADGQTVRRFSPPLPTHPQLGVLVDVPRRRMLVGSAPVVQSTLVQLFYLDGQYATHYEKFDERVTYYGARVVTWKIRWEGRPAVAATPSATHHNPLPLSAPRPE